MTSKKIPLSERPDSDVKCARPECNQLAKVGSAFCCKKCSQIMNNRGYRATLSNKLELKENHVAPDVEDFETRWKRIYLKYGTDYTIKQKFMRELQDRS